MRIYQKMYIFDPGAMMCALERFGVPAQVLNILQAIYTDRVFQVADSGTISEKKAATFWHIPGMPTISVLICHGYVCTHE